MEGDCWNSEGRKRFGPRRRSLQVKRGDRGAGIRVEGTARAEPGLQQNQGTGLHMDGSGTRVRNRASTHSD